MSEEEIIKYLKTIKPKNFNNYKNETLCSIITKKQIKAIQGLLFLYKKEKEKNEKLKTLLYQIRNELRWKVIIQEDGIYKPCKNLTKQQIYESYVKLNLMLKANYIFKNNEKAIEELLKEGD